MNYSISAFFPAYNEEENVVRLIEDADKALKNITDTYEIIIIKLKLSPTKKTEDMANLSEVE